MEGFWLFDFCDISRELFLGPDIILQAPNSYDQELFHDFKVCFCASNVFFRILKLEGFSKWLPHPVHYLKNKVEVVDFANAQGLKHKGFCKIYYSHFIFEVITFLRNHSKKLSNYGSF